LHSVHSVNALLNRSFESGFECDYTRSTSDLLWKLVPAVTGIVAKIRLLSA